MHNLFAYFIRSMLYDEFRINKTKVSIIYNTHTHTHTHTPVNSWVVEQCFIVITFNLLLQVTEVKISVVLDTLKLDYII